MTYFSRVGRVEVQPTELAYLLHKPRIVRSREARDPVREQQSQLEPKSMRQQSIDIAAHWMRATVRGRSRCSAKISLTDS